MSKMSKYCCLACNKEYIKKSSLDKHKILCDYKYKTAREKEIEIEELGDEPTYSQLVKIVQEMALKMNKMEAKMMDMQKWVDKKKKKINVIDWLSKNVSPTVGFNDWVNSYFKVNQSHFLDLMENTLLHTIQQVFEYNLSEQSDIIYPLRCFSQKTGNFYIAVENAEGNKEWRLMEITDFTYLLKIFQNKMIAEITKWQAENKELLQENDKQSIVLNKTIMKLMNVPFTAADATMGKIKNGLYTYLKTDLTNIMEYDFDF